MIDRYIDREREKKREREKGRLREEKERERERERSSIFSLIDIGSIFFPKTKQKQYLYKK